MTCHELRLYFEDPMRTDARFDVEAEHLAHCEECTRFVERQQELGAGLRLARMSGPTVPPSLDETILANYRSQIAERRPLARTTSRRRFVILGWSAAAAAAAIVLVAALLMFNGRRTTATVAPPEPAPAVTAPQPIASTPPAVKPQARPQKRSPPQRRPQPSEPSNLVLTGALPPDFRSLMYCDELSCSGAMQVIRMQLPASAAVFAPDSNSANGTILADVLVGADGIARGIRIVE